MYRFSPTLSDLFFFPFLSFFLLLQSALTFNDIPDLEICSLSRRTQILYPVLCWVQWFSQQEILNFHTLLSRWPNQRTQNMATQLLLLAAQPFPFQRYCFWLFFCASSFFTYYKLQSCLTMIIIVWYCSFYVTWNKMLLYLIREGVLIVSRTLTGLF